MGPATSMKRAGLAALGGSVVALSVAGAGIAASSNADFSLSASPATLTVNAGQSIGSTISLNSTSGFSGSVSLTASVTGKPSTATSTSLGVALSPTSVSKAAPRASLTISTSSTTPQGNYTVTVTGSGSPGVRTTTVGIAVQPQPAADYSLSVSPTAAPPMLPGSTGQYTVNLSRSGFNGQVTLAATGLPTGATASFAPVTTTGNSSNLQIATKNNTPAGTYAFTVSGSAAGEPPVTASANLVITSSGRSFTISATPVQGVTLGEAPQPVDLTITNPNNQALAVTNITVSIQSVTQAVGATGSCAAGDYVVTQIAAANYPFTVNANNGTLDLGAAGLTPLIGMVDDTARNQDGCKGATVHLLFTGTGQGA